MALTTKRYCPHFQCILPHRTLTSPFISNHGLPDRRFDEKGYQDTIEYWKTKIQKRCEKEHKLCVTREELSDMECSRYLQEVLVRV